MTLPLLMPGIVAASAISMILSFDEFTISLFLTGPGLKTLPVQIYDHVEFNIDPLVAAVGTLLIAVTVFVVLVIERSLGLKRAFRI